MEDGTDDVFTALINEQRRELMAAQSVDSDAEYAFNLQMQEAMASSMVSTSASTNPPPPVSVVVSAPKASGESSSFSLMREEMERYMQEHNDRKLCKAEFEHMREDLNRRVYDLKFAADISSIPEVEWKKYGDNYHKPFSAGASSSSAGTTDEGFRIHCKGLVREEWIKETKIVAAGIGVAICDIKENVLFEIKKPLIHAGMVSEFEAEIEALISGLDAALILDMKLAKVLIGDNDIYSWVAGLKTPTSTKVGALVNQAILIRNKFTNCRFIHSVGDNGNGMKSAFKLARDAIVSQINWPEQTTDGNHWRETCSICFEDTDVSQIFSVDECLHRYCFSCMRKHVEAKLHNAVEVRCPDIQCKSTVKVDSCEKFLEPNLVSIMTHRMKEKSVPAEERVYCPYPRCSTLMSRTEVLKYSEAWFVGAERSGARKCMKCQYYFCIECGVPWHYNMSCTDFRRSKHNPGHGDGKLKSLAKAKAWRQCIKCKNMVELASGCYHITCRCGYEFCYTCGAEWRNKKPTCKCPIWDERNLINGRRPL